MNIWSIWLFPFALYRPVIHHDYHMHYALLNKRYHRLNLVYSTFLPNYLAKILLWYVNINGCMCYHF